MRIVAAVDVVVVVAVDAAMVAAVAAMVVVVAGTDSFNPDKMTRLTSAAGMLVSNSWRAPSLTST